MDLSKPKNIPPQLFYKNEKEPSKLPIQLTLYSEDAVTLSDNNHTMRWQLARPIRLEHECVLSLESIFGNFGQDPLNHSSIVKIRGIPFKSSFGSDDNHESNVLALMPPWERQRQVLINPLSDRSAMIVPAGTTIGDITILYQEISSGTLYATSITKMAYHLRFTPL